MARIFKIFGYLVDANGDYDAKQLEVALKEDYDLIAHHIRVEERDIGEWEDDCPLNYFDCPKEECEKYFDHPADVAPKSEVAREIFEEIELFLNKAIDGWRKERGVAYNDRQIEMIDFRNGAFKYCLHEIAELKKKYTGEQT